MGDVVESSGGLAAKLVRIAQAVGPIEKDGRNEGQKYDYTTAEAVIREVREKMLGEGILLVEACTHSERDTDSNMTTVELLYELIDTESGEKWSIPYAGQGWDKGDKGIWKAYTGARKYFLRGVLSLSFGEDPEADSPPPAGLAEKAAPPKRAAAPGIPNGRKKAIGDRLRALDLLKGSSLAAPAKAKLAELGAKAVNGLDVDQAEGFEAWLTVEEGHA